MMENAGWYGGDHNWLLSPRWAAPCGAVWMMKW